MDRSEVVAPRRLGLELTEVELLEVQRRQQAQRGLQVRRRRARGDLEAALLQRAQEWRVVEAIDLLQPVGTGVAIGDDVPDVACVSVRGLGRRAIALLRRRRDRHAPDREAGDRDEVHDDQRSDRDGQPDRHASHGRRRQSPDHHEAERRDQRPHRQQVPVEPEALADEVPDVAIGHREPDEERHRQRGTRSAHANGPSQAQGDQQQERGTADRQEQRHPEIAQGELLGDVLREEKQDRKCSDQQRVQQPRASDRWLSQFVASSSPSPAPFGRPAAYRIGR